jgi:hypothetical protein
MSGHEQSPAGESPWGDSAAGPRGSPGCPRRYGVHSAFAGAETAPLAPPVRWGWGQVTALGVLVGSGAGAFGWWSGHWSLAALLGLAGGVMIGRYGAGRRP